MKIKNIRVLKMLTAVSIAVALLFSGIPTAYAADLLAGTPAELATALTNAGDGDTIRLTADIDYDNQIDIQHKAITLDVQNFDLNVTSASGAGLYVLDGGVRLAGSGDFNVYGYDSGVAVNDGEATVTNAIATKPDSGCGAEISNGSSVHVLGNVTGYYGVYAIGSDTSIEIDGNLFANGSGGENAVYAVNGAEVTVHGNVDSFLTGSAAYTSNGGSHIYIGGNVTAASANNGVYADNGGSVTVDGDVQALGCGAFASNGIISISGDVTATSGGGIGAIAGSGGQITIGGAITANTYARVNSVDKAISDRTVPTTKLGYATYSDGADTVWVLAPTYDFSAMPSNLPSAGGDSVITLTGVDLPAGITITAFDGATPTAITGTASGSDTSQRATLTFPANASETADNVYTIRASKDGGESWESIMSTVIVERGSGTVIEVPTLPVVVTGAASDVTSSGAVLSGSVTDDGGMEVTERGFVYGSDADPAIGDAGVTKIAAGSGTGAFNTALLGLAPNTTYHVRAYAINGQGTAYGTNMSFKTLANELDGIPKTGDDSSALIWWLLCGVSAAGAAALLLFGKKKYCR